MPCANLRLFSVYGPLEDSSRLIPDVIRCGLEGKYPPFVNRAISRDFVYVDDVCEAYVDTALNLREPYFGDSFNIGSGRKTTIAEVAQAAAELFSISSQPVFGAMEPASGTCATGTPTRARPPRCCAGKRAPSFARACAGPPIGTAAWKTSSDTHRSSKQFAWTRKRSVSAIVACYKDDQAIPIMYERLKKTFDEAKIDYEIIFVNDNSPDNSEEVIRDLSSRDRRVVGISHSRNFGSQAAFRSGMEIATKNACVLLDGDLQDPPELIGQFVGQWQRGLRRGLRAAGQARGISLHAPGLQALLSALRCLLVSFHPARCRRFFLD